MGEYVSLNTAQVVRSTVSRPSATPTGVIGASFAVVLLFLGHPSFAIQPSDTMTASLEKVHAEYGVTIKYHYKAEEFFPTSWLRQPINGRGEQIDLDALPSPVKVLNGFLGRYLKSVVKRNLKTVFLMSDLEFYGKSYGGTHSRTAVYLRIGNDKRIWSDVFLTSRLHSEFSSILIQNYDFPTTRWQALNTAGFKYSGSGVEVLGTKKLYGQTEELLEQGFLVRYSQSSLENDFNMLSDWLFTRPEKLAELCQKHELLASKRTLAIEFYASIDKRLKFE